MPLELVTAIDAENPIIGDLRLVNGRLQWIGHDRDDDAEFDRVVAQRLRTRLLTFLGEWYQDQTIGTPWRQSLFGTGVTVARSRSIIRRIIISTPGVAGVKALTVSMDRGSRVATCSFTAVTDIGTSVSIADLASPLRATSPEVDRG